MEHRKRLMMKKIIVGLLSLILSVTVVGCSNSDSKVEGPEGTLSEIVEEIYAAKDTEFMLQTNEVDMSDENIFKSYTGLSSTDGVKEAVASETMMGSQAYSLVLVRVNDASDANDVSEEMKENIDQRKWICVEADDLQVVSANDVVMLIMMSTEFKDTITSQEIVDAFSDISGGLDNE